jgi:hypothetical protein
MAEDEKFNHLPGFGGQALNSKDDLTSYMFRGYPDALDSYAMTTVRTENTEISVFGLSVGDSFFNARTKLMEFKYTIVASVNPTGSSETYSKDNITIVLFIGDGLTICQLSINVETTNNSGIIFW